MSAFNKGRFESSKQDWTTPDSLFEPLDIEFGFTLDAAASKENAKCARFISKEQDGLLTQWGYNEVVWVNPPYGASIHGLKKWCEKALNETGNGNTSVLLIPARTNTVWFHELCLEQAEVRFIKGRPKFGDNPHGLPQPLCLVIFKPKR